MFAGNILSLPDLAKQPDMCKIPNLSNTAGSQHLFEICGVAHRGVVMAGKEAGQAR
jgi:hypothetical protein